MPNREEDALSLVEKFLSGVLENEGSDIKDKFKASELVIKTAPQEREEQPKELTVRIIYGE